MKKVCIFLGEGFEEVEAVSPADLLMRAGAEVMLVSIGDKREVAGAHGIVYTADKLFDEVDYTDVDLLVLPGGMPGTLHLKEYAPLIALLKKFNDEGKMLAAICAAPTVLGAAGLLNGKKATCYPGCEEGLTGAITLTDTVVIDGNITTSRGPGTAVPFGLSLAAQLFGQETADQVQKDFIY